MRFCKKLGGLKPLWVALALGVCLGWGADGWSAEEAAAKAVPSKVINAGDALRNPALDNPIVVIPSECSTDADCKDIDGLSCTKPKCLGIVDPITGKGKDTCVDQPVYAIDTPEYQCCKAGIDETSADKWKCCVDNKGVLPPAGCPSHVQDKCDLKFAGDDVAIKCCKKHVAAGEPVIDPATGKLIPCNGETCPACPDCNKQPTVDCSVIADSELKSCCVAKGGMLYFVMAACVHSSSDCNIVVNVGGDVNGQMNVCCNVLNNTGTITDSTITQACSNTNGGGTSGGTATAGTPTTPEGAGPTALTCAVALVGEPVDGKWSVTYSAPPSIGPVASATLTQISGPQIRVEGGTDDGGFGTDVTSPKSMATKSISDPANPPAFDVTSPTPKSLAGNWAAPFQVKVTLSDLAGAELASATCTDTFKLEAKGSGCGCFLGASPVEFAGNAVFLISIFGGLPALALFLRRKR